MNPISATSGCLLSDLLTFYSGHIALTAVCSKHSQCLLLPQDIGTCCSLCLEIPSPDIYMAAHPFGSPLKYHLIHTFCNDLYNTGMPLSTATQPSLHICFSLSHSTCHLTYCIFPSLLIYCPFLLPKCKCYEGRDIALLMPYLQDIEQCLRDKFKY